MANGLRKAETFPRGAHEHSLVKMMHKGVKVSLIGGKYREGVLKGFDKFSVTLEIGKVERVLFKHAIQEIFPS